MWSQYSTKVFSQDSCIPQPTSSSAAPGCPADTQKKCYWPIAGTLWGFIGVLGLCFIWFLHRIGFFAWAWKAIKSIYKTLFETVKNIKNLKQLQEEFRSSIQAFVKETKDAQKKLRVTFIKDRAEFLNGLQQTKILLRKKERIAQRYVIEQTNQALRQKNNPSVILPEGGLTNFVQKQLNTAQLGPAQLGPAQLGPAQLGPAQLGPAQLGPAPEEITAIARATEGRFFV